MKKAINVEKSEVLYDRPFSNDGIGEDWDIKCGEWSVDGEWLEGKNPLNAPGMIVSKENFFGDVLLDFEAMTVPPCTHDIDAMWNGCWDDEKGERGVAYVAGLEGWWQGKVGIEKSPEYRMTAVTPLFDFEPGRVYHVQCGSIDGHCFVFVDGRLMLELTDPDPIDSQKYGKIGFEAYCSHIRVRNLKVLRINWDAVDMEYKPEFGC